MQQWEYLVHTAPAPGLKAADKDIQGEMARLGAEGWELVGVTLARTGIAVYCYFKRPVGE